MENGLVDIDREREGRTNRESNVTIYITIWKVNSQWTLLCDAGSSACCSVTT